jgi:LPXTG-motif cell wall-anchored protein
MEIGSDTHPLPSWVPTLPMNTPQWAEAIVGIALVVLLVVFLVRRRRAKARQVVG